MIAEQIVEKLLNPPKVAGFLARKGAVTIRVESGSYGYRTARLEEGKAPVTEALAGTDAQVEEAILRRVVQLQSEGWDVVAGSLAIVEDIEHLYQETPYDCGPTCVKMVASALGKAEDMSLEDLRVAAGSDPTTGTDDKKMVKALKAAGVPFQIGDAKDPAGLVSALERGSFIILRTLTRGIKHWIVVYGWDGHRFQVNDPWLGQLDYFPRQIVNIWKPRDFYYFEIPRMTEAVDAKLVPITDENWPAVEKLLLEAWPQYSEWLIEYIQGHMDRELSVAAVEGGQVVGCYILGRRSPAQAFEEENLEPTEDLSAYEGKKGVEGVALAVSPAVRGQGLGSQLIRYPEKLGADYVWGLQLKDLENLPFWLKRRRVIGQNDSTYATLQDLSAAPAPAQEGLRRLRDLQAMPDDQLYLCSDASVAERHKLKVPFECGCRLWVGGGLVRVELLSNDPHYGTYQVSDYAPLKTLEPVPGKTWHFDDPPGF